MGWMIRGSNPKKGKRLTFSKMSRPGLGFTQHPFNGCQGLSPLPRGKMAGT
jgi:hypothetical protein